MKPVAYAMLVVVLAAGCAKQEPAPVEELTEAQKQFPGSSKDVAEKLFAAKFAADFEKRAAEHKIAQAKAWQEWEAKEAARKAEEQRKADLAKAEQDAKDEAAKKAKARAARYDSATVILLSLSYATKEEKAAWQDECKRAPDGQKVKTLYGSPDYIDSTENRRPPPPIVTRIYQYRKADVDLVFGRDRSGWQFVGSTHAGERISLVDADAKLKAAGYVPLKDFVP